MAFLECHFHSDCLGMAVSANVILPQRAVATQIGMDGAREAGAVPVLYLLHGLSDDHTIWMRRTSIERYAAQYGLAVVMPACGRSFYCNTANGERYWDFVSQELPEFIGDTFQVSRRREDTFAAGLSMGGYGALKLGVRCPERYAAVAALSGAFFLEHWQGEGDGFYQSICPNTPVFRGSEQDLTTHIRRLATKSAAEKPLVFLAAGTEDGLYPQTLEIRDCLMECGFEVKFISAPGNHNWEFWDRHIQEVLAWLPLRHPEISR